MLKNYVKNNKMHLQLKMPKKAKKYKIKLEYSTSREQESNF